MAFWTRKEKTSGSGAEFDLSASHYAVLNDVSLDLGTRQVLQNVSLNLCESRVGIVGLNGSGKSNLVRLLNGLRLPTSGEVRIFGASTSVARYELPRHVGFVFQNPDHQAIFPTVEEEIAFGLSQLGVGKVDARIKALAFLEQHHSGDLAQKPFADLSEGQKQFICLLAVLVMNPKLLVLDEPMSSLDGLATRRIFRRLEGLDQKIIMISHDLSLLKEFDRVIWLEAGRVKMDGMPMDVLPAYDADIVRQVDVEQSGDAL